MQSLKSLADKLAPYRATHADMSKIPEVIQDRAETAVQVAAMETEARVVESQLARIQAILRGVAR
jgi:hypothetical protein